MEYAGRPVLVTGGAGFIGSHLAERLAALGARVTVLDSLQDGSLENLRACAAAVRFLQGDVRDGDAVAEAVRGQEVVFHLAANASVPRSVQQPEEDFAANALGSQRVLLAAVRAGVRRVVYASSAAVYGTPRGRPFREEDAPAPVSPYGASKLAGEALGLAYAHAYGLEFVALRVFNTYGPRQPRYVLSDLLRKLHGDPARLEVLGDGTQVRDYCYVTDTVAAFLLAGAAPGAAGRALNLATGRPVSIRHLVERLLAILGLEGVEVTYTGASWPGDIRALVGDGSRLRALGFVPQVDLEEGLRRTVAWFRSERAATAPAGG